MSALTDVFTAIANAIRGKNGLSTTYKPNQMAQAITDLPSGADDTPNIRIVGGTDGVNLVSSDGEYFLANNQLDIPVGISSIIYDDVTDCYYIGCSTAYEYGIVPKYYVYLFKVTNEGVVSPILIGNLTTGLYGFTCLRRVRSSGTGIRFLGFFALSSYQYFITSNNGETWTRRAFSNFSNVVFAFYSTTSNRYYIFNTTGTGAYSTNATSWTTFTTSITTGGYKFAYSPTLDEVVAVPISTASNKIYISVNNTYTSWNNYTNPTSQGFTALEWCESISKFVGVTTGNKISVSADGSNWTTVTISNLTGTLQSIDWSDVTDSKVLITTQYGEVVTTEDGVRWQVTLKPKLSIGYVASKKTYSY